MSEQSNQVEVLSFRRNNQTATVASNGRRHVTQVGNEVKEHATLPYAIAYLEMEHFEIDTDNFKVF